MSSVPRKAFFPKSCTPGNPLASLVHGVGQNTSSTFEKNQSTDSSSNFHLFLKEASMRTFLEVPTSQLNEFFFLTYFLSRPSRALASVLNQWCQNSEARTRGRISTFPGNPSTGNGTALVLTSLSQDLNVALSQQCLRWVYLHLVNVDVS